MQLLSNAEFCATKTLKQRECDLIAGEEQTKNCDAFAILHISGTRFKLWYSSSEIFVSNQLLCL